MPGIDSNLAGQFELLRHLKQYTNTIMYPRDDPGDERTYFYNNDQYPVLDAEFLHAALCHFRTKDDDRSR